MYNAMLHLHSGGRWILLLLILIAIFRSITAGKRNFTRADQTTGLLVTIFADIMLLVGIYLYMAGNWGYKQIENFGGMGEVMKNDKARFFAIEHVLAMVVAIVLLHIGKAQGKKDLPHATKHKRTALFFSIALLIILLSIPWPFRELFTDRGWF